MRAALVSFVMAAACAHISCAHTPDLALRPDPAPPIGSTTEVVTAPDGTLLLARHWAPIDAPRAVVVIMHGLKDHSARYAAFATRLTGAGYSVYAFDLRGHGRSSGKRVAPGRWWDYVDDLDRFLAHLETREPGRPVFVLGHSMGGAIAAATAIQHQPPIAGLVLSGAALAIDAPPLLIAATRMAGALTPGFPGLTLPNGDFSSDPAARAAMDADPLVSQPPGPARTAAGLVDGIRRIWAGASALTMPVLALHGTRDKLTAPAGSRMLIETIPSTDKTLRIYDGLFHDLLHEPRGAQVADDIIAWLDAHTGGSPVAPPPIYRGHLGGDPRGWTQAIGLGVGVAFEDPTGGTAWFTDDTGFAGQLDVRLARPAPFGWGGALSGRIVGHYKAATLAPVGVAVRFHVLGTRPVTIGLASGGSVISGAHFAIPVAVWAEAAAPGVHLSYTGELSYRIGGEPPRRAALSSDATSHSISFMLGRDRKYWPGALAGVAPSITFTQTTLEDVKAFSLLVGLQLYGAD